MFRRAPAVAFEGGFRCVLHRSLFWVHLCTLDTFSGASNAREDPWQFSWDSKTPTSPPGIP